MPVVNPYVSNTTFDTISLWTGLSATLTGGALTFPYPTGRVAEEYLQGSGAVISVHETQGVYTQGTDFILSYGATSVVARWRSLTTIPAGSTAIIQLPLQDAAVLAVAAATVPYDLV